MWQGLDHSTDARRNDAGAWTSIMSTLPTGTTQKLVVGMFLGGLVFVGLALYADFNALARTMTTFEPRFFVIALCLATGNYALRFVRWQLYLHTLGFRVPTRTSALVFLAGFVMSITPGKVGEVFKSVLLREHHGAPIATTAPIVVAERVTDFLALVLLTAIGSLAFPVGWPIAAAGLFFVGAVLLVVAVKPMGDLAIRIAGKLPKGATIAPKLNEAYGALRTLSRPGTLLAASALSVGAWALECVALGVVLMGFGPRFVDWTGSVFAYSASTIAGAVAPGGLGITDASMTGFVSTMAAHPMNRTVATAATILTRLATLWWAVALGLVAFAVLRSKRSELHSETREVTDDATG